MKKLKKSMKIIISLVCVFLVAVAAVVTVVLVTKKKDKSPEDPTPSAYALTDAQKKLVDEINLTNSTMVSSSKLDVTKIDTSSLPDAAGVEDWGYFDDSIAWSESGGSYNIYVNIFDSDSQAYVWKSFEEVLQLKSIITGTPNLELIQICENHIRFGNKIDDNNYDWYILTIKNHDVFTEKHLQWSSTDASISTFHLFLIGDDFYANVEEDNEKYYFRFYLYGSDVVKYSYEIDDYANLPKYSIIGNAFKYMETSETVLVEYSDGKFSTPNNDENVTYYNLKKGSLIETRTESTADNAKSYLSGSKYYTYSYKFVSSSGTEKDIDLGDYTKITSNYSGENYFELFFQKVDDHYLLSSGEMVYYDYNLTEVLKYSADTQSSTIFYSDGTMVLTSEGFFAGKNTVELTKYSSLVDEDLNLSFDRYFSNGSFALATQNNDFYIYNNKNQGACEMTFDKVVYFIDDVNVILEKNSLHFRYNLSTNSYENVDFIQIDNLDSNAPLYMLKKNGKKILYKGLTELKNDVDEVKVDLNNKNLIVVSSGSTNEYYYLTEKSTTTSSQVGFSGSVTNQNTVELYDASSEPETWFDASNDTEYTEPEWYDYNDKVLYYKESNKYTIKASHCITNGLYSAYTYFDFFEIAYNNGSQGESYRPLRIYYQVTIGTNDNPNAPALKIIAVGHITNVVRMASAVNGLGNNIYTYKAADNSLAYYYFGSSNEYNMGSNEYLKKDVGAANTYDYSKTSSNVTSYYYAYIGDNIINLSDLSTVEVYGNSIRVNLQFDIEQDDSYSLNLKESKFGYTKLSGDVYYDGTSVIGRGLYSPLIHDNFKSIYNDSDFEKWREKRENYYNELYYKTVVVGINNYSTNYTDITASSSANFNGIISDENALTISKQSGETTLNLAGDGYYAYISDKNYLDKSTSVIKFGANLQERIVGAKIIGITTVNSTVYGISNSDLYSAGTYIDDMIEYRTYADSNASSSNINLPKSYLTKGGDGYYTMQIDNESSIYYDGGLNYFRFIFCVYAPETYYIQLDYNISGERGTSVDSEIDYLKNYAGLTIGQDGSVDRISYRNTWAYSKAETSDEFKNATVASGKYKPNDFTNISNRQTTLASANNEYTADVKQFITKGEYYYYVIVDGIKYYFQRINDPTQKKYTDLTNSYYVAYRDYSVLSTKGNFETSNASAYNANFYAEGDTTIIIKLKNEDKSKFTYHKMSDHVRTSVYEGHYSYSGGTLSETSNTTYTITETFSFLYTDPILFESNPEHIHYTFIGWKVLTGDYAGKIINTSKTAGVANSTDLIGLSTNVNPYKNQYLAGSGDVYNQLWLLSGNSSASNPIVLQAVWEAVTCEIDAVFYTIENSGENSEYKGLSFDKNTKLIDDGLISITNSGVMPIFYNLVTEDGSSRQEKINNNDGTVIKSKIKITFQYDPTKTLNTIYISYIEGALTDGYSLKPSSILTSDALLKQFGSWAVENINRSGSEQKYIPINGDVYEDAKSIKINQFIVDTTTLTIYAYYSEALYKIDTKIYPNGGATVDKTGKTYSSGSSVYYNNSDIYNDTQNFAKITMVVSGGTDGSQMYKYANYATDGFTQLTMADDDFYYLQKFDTHYYVGETINFLIEESNEKYFLSKIVFTNLTLSTNTYSNGAYKKDKFTLTLTRKSDGNWVGTAVGDHNNNKLTVTIDNNGKLTIGIHNGSENVIQLNTTSDSSKGGSESHYSLTVSTLTNPGNLDYSKQLFGNDGTGFNVEFYFEAYTLKNETMEIEYVSTEELNFDYNRLVMSSCQPLTNKEGKSLKTNGTEDAYVWFWSSKYLFAKNWVNTATSGYYLIFNSTMIEAVYHDDFIYEDFIEQTLTEGDSVIIYYDDETKMVYFPTQTKSNTSTDFKVLGSFSSETQSRNLYYSFVNSSGSFDYYYLGSASYSSLTNGSIYVMKKGSNTTLQKVTDVELTDKCYESGCDEFYVKITKKKTRTLNKNIGFSEWGGSGLVYSVQYTYRVYITYAKKDNSLLSSEDGLYTSAGNTRVIAFDPEQSRTYYSGSYSADTQDDYNFDLEYYITSVTIGTDTFSFDNIYSEFTRASSDDYYQYSYLKMHCTNDGYGSITGSGNYIKYLGSYYTVNDVFKLKLSNTENKKGATEYFFFITKSADDNFVRYFLIYDIAKTNFNQEAKVSDVSYDIKFKIDMFDKNLEINVTEEDVYDVTAMTGNYYYYNSALSFNVDYKKTAMQYDADNFKDKKETSGTFKVKLNSAFNSETADDFTFYQTQYATSDGNTFSSSDNLLKNYSSKNLVNSITWSSSTKFYPSSATKYVISARNGYIIKSLAISLVYYDYTQAEPKIVAKLISFEIDDKMSFEEIYYNSKYSYTTGNEGNVQSKIRYKVVGTEDGTLSYGLKIASSADASNGKGLMFSNNASSTWDTKAETYTLDQIFLLLSSIYNDVIIDVTTTSYVEFMFENGESGGDANPLLKTNKNSLTKVDGQAYANISLSDTYITFCAKGSNYIINTDNGYLDGKFILRYYVDAIPYGVKKGAIRLIFYGTGSLLKYGFDILGTTEDHSAYFTNGRYYNEDSSLNSDNAFLNLTSYSGRTNADNVIVKKNRIKTDKLVYMGYGDSSHKYLTGYYRSHENNFETNYKYFMVTEVHLNNIDVETSSYLFNYNLASTTWEKMSSSSTVPDSVKDYNSSSGLYYKFYEEDGKSRLYIGNNNTQNLSNFNIYQLDNTSKQQSWFNNKVLTNIEYSYYGGTRNWVNMSSGVSELAKVKMQGLNFNWKYYEIVGYQLKYILIELADIGKYYIKEVNHHASSEDIEFKNASGIEFKFKIQYDFNSERGGCYTLSPYASDSFDNATLLDYVALMSNNIKVSFVSMAATYNLIYQNYDFNGKISTDSTIDTQSQSIYYDNMTKLGATASMDGYTFIGWGSYNYYDGNNFVNRYSLNDETNHSTWNTSSSWFDPTEFFVQSGKTGIESAKLLYTFYKSYSEESSTLPCGSFFTAGSYFMTDTGLSGESSQNYNFFATYLSIFGRGYGGGDSSINTINLYALYKANTYLIQFDVNSASNEAYYLDYNSLGNFNCEFENNNTAFRVKNATTTISFYVTFDTNDWYFISGSQSLMYSFKNDNVYTVGNVVDNNYLSTVVSDKFGYSWLGWWYTKNTNINEGTSISNTKKSQVVFGSQYLKNKYSYTQTTLIKFDKVFYNVLKGSGSISDSSFTKQDFIYKNQHNSLNSDLDKNSYVYFYDYSASGHGNGSLKFQIAGINYDYTKVSDYLNTFATTTQNNSGLTVTTPYYEKSSSSAFILSYYDTCYGKECYNVIPNAAGNGYILQLNKSSLDNLRTIKLYANWVNNKYTVIFDSLDTNGQVEQTGSSTADFTFTSNNKTFYFNDTTMQDYLLGKENELPSRIGYDFVGWSFNYIKTDGTYASANSLLVSNVNSASKNLYLCSDLLSEYAILSGLSGTDDLESNILMINGSRLSSIGDDWILNASGKAERLGDGETGTRYIYIFPVWRVQSFSVNISLNIGKEELDNLFEKDSSFALGLYKSSEHTDYLGVSSKNYTYNTTKTSLMSDNSYYKEYYADIVANICFEIDFDQEFSEAKIIIDNKTYTLKDLFATSAGYYFLGLLYENSGNDYIVQNTLNSVFTLDGLTHDNASGTVAYKQNADTSTYKFDINSYAKLHRTDYVLTKRTSAADDYRTLSAINAQKVIGKNSVKASTNFGYLTANIYNYNNSSVTSQNLYIMSELSGGQYYLYVLHNNVKYYVVFYQSLGTGSKDYVDCIEFDRTYLYYKIVENERTVARYIIRFDSNGDAYYVDDTYKNAHKINLKIAMYLSPTNKLNTSLSEGIISWSATNTDGNILSPNATNYQLITGAFASKNSGVTLTSTTTREFTLYADWQKRKIEAKVTNGNNSSSIASDNQGLAGYYEITVNGNTSISSQDGDKFTTSGKIDFYSHVDYNFLPYYNGRYLSEMAFEFDTFEETTTSGVTSFAMVHNKLVLNFEWKNSDTVSDHIISISKITLNNRTWALSTSLTRQNASEYVDNILNFEVLSIIDKYSMGTTTSALKIYAYQTSTAYFGGRTDYNKLTLALTELMCDLNITCKFSVQTFKVEVYNVEVENQPTLIEDGSYSGFYSTDFRKLTDMQTQSNYSEFNQANLGLPYVSNLNYNTSTMSTISTDCAANLKSYNVPYYFFITYSNLGDGTTTDPQGFYGINYLYKNNYYYNGTLNTFISQYNNSLETIANKITGANGAYTTIDGYWFEYAGDTDGVKLEKYDQTVPVRQNKVIYGTFVSSTASVRVFFHYWDNTKGEYVHYGEIDAEYTSGSTDSKLIKHVNDDGSIYYSIDTLPSSNYSPWLNNSNFLGFIYLNSNILSNFTEEGLNEKYCGYEYSDSNVYVNTSRDAYSAFALGKVKYDKTVDYTGYSSLVDYYYQKYIKTLTVIDLFNYQLNVVNNKYYTKTATVIDNSFAKDTSILDAVRLNVGIKIQKADGTNQIVNIQKDFKMLNVETKLPSNGIVYAIPIYADIDFRIKAANIEGTKTINLTTNSNMLDAVVFKINPKYTLFYDPRDIRIIVSETKIDLQDSRVNILKTIDNINKKGNNSSGYYKFEKVQRGSSDNLGNYYGLFTYSPSSFNVNKTYYIYYYYVDSGGVPVYYAENYLKLSVNSSSKSISYELSDKNSSETPTTEEIESFVSPFEFELKGTYLAQYNAVKEEIEDTSLSKEVKTNRKLLIYIALQLMQSGYLEIVNSNDTYSDIYFYSDNFSTSPTDSGGGDYSIESLIKIINTNYTMGEATKIYTSHVGFYRMVYSLAYSFVKERTINGGDATGLQELYGHNNSGNGVLFDAINSTFGYYNASGVHYNSTPYAGDLLKDNISSASTLVYNYYNGETKTIYTTVKNVKTIMLLSCTRSDNTFTFKYIDSNGSGLVIKEFTFTLSDDGISEYQANDGYNRFMLATGDLRELSGTTSSKVKGLAGYDNKEAYIVSGSQNYILTLKYDGYNNDGTTTVRENVKTYSNCSTYTYKEVGNSETKIIKLYDNYYLYSNAIAAGNETISALLSGSRTYANANYESNMNSATYISNLTIYKYNSQTNTNNELVYLKYTKSQMELTGNSGNVSGNYVYTFNTEIIDYLTKYYGYQASNDNYDTYLNAELQTYYDERFNEVKEDLDANSGSWYTSYLAWYKEEHWDASENNYINGSLKYNSLYDALLEEKKTAIINSYKNALADEYMGTITNEQVYNYVLNHKDDYGYDLFKESYILNNLSTLTLDQIKLYFDTDSDGVVDNDAETYNLIRSAMADEYYLTITNDDVYSYILSHKADNAYSGLITALKDNYYANLTTAQIQAYFENTSDSTNIAWVKAIMTGENIEELENDDVYNYVLSNKNESKLSTLKTNMLNYYYNNLTTTEIGSYCSNNSSNETVKNAISSAKSSLRSNYYNNLTLEQVGNYYSGKQTSLDEIYTNSLTTTYLELKNTIQNYLFDNEKGGVTKALKISYYATNYSYYVANAKMAMREDYYGNLTAQNVYENKKSEADITAQAIANISKAEKDNMIEEQAKIDTTAKANYEAMKANEYKEANRSKAEQVAESMVKYAPYLEASNKYLKDLEGKLKEKLALEYIEENYSTTFKNKLSAYSTYKFTENSGTNYKYQSIIKNSDNSVQCRVYLFNANIWYYNLTPNGSYSVYNKTAYTENTGYDSGNIWIINKTSGNIDNIYTRFSSFFGG